MEAEEDLLEDLEITVDDSLLQISLDCEPKGEEESDEQEATPHPVSTVSYVEELKSKSDLKVLHECNVITVFARYAELGLFHLFLLKSWFKAMLQWTNKSLQSKRKNK
jgi:hypothetical protein